jgi:hypothetical protein
MQLPNFSDRLPANAVLKTCNMFKVIHGFTREVSTCHLFFGRLALGIALPRGVEIALPATSKISALFMFLSHCKFHVMLPIF